MDTSVDRGDRTTGVAGLKTRCQSGMRLGHFLASPVRERQSRLSVVRDKRFETLFPYKEVSFFGAIRENLVPTLVATLIYDTKTFSSAL